MKHLIILGDGMADWAVPQLGGKTLLEYAATPHLDRLAQHGRNGLLKTIPDGFHPGSEVANSSILGYDQHIVYEGRGPLEAASIGVELDADDLAMRCNLVCLEGDLLKNHSCGRLETEEADVLIRFLQEKLGNDRIHFYTGVQYRHLLVIKGGNKQLNCTPPHDIPLKPWRENLPHATSEGEGSETASLLVDLILKSQELLKDHPLNIERQQRGMDPANSIWPWGGGYRPRMVPLTTTYPQIKKGSVITAVDLIRGIGKYAGLRVLDVEGATGLWDTNYEGKAEAAIQALREGDDFVYVHVEASDEAGHDGNLELKLQTIENLDNRLVRPILEALPTIGEEVSIAVLPDHPTPISLRTHTAEPIPFCIYYPGIEPDGVQTFSETAAKQGSYGSLEGDQFIQTFMKSGQD
ncbi:MAG: cofactor-independent phosphoglycerate mutase [Bacteroidaceae bacterium]|nr:cofactor-independent phosphoglycerate mutase [Bacteroidaceae bacterium]MBR1902258.1 cofactor-independent phosphoglycerate mutase [Bacteroidaceae bacterium]